MVHSAVSPLDCICQPITTKCQQSASSLKELESSQNNASSRVDPKLNKIVAQIESRLQVEPNNRRLISNFLTVLDFQAPRVSGTSAYSQCQRALIQVQHAQGAHFGNTTRNSFFENYGEWKSILNAPDLNKEVAIAQLFEGKEIQFNEKPADCGNYLNMFNKTGVISNVCFDCYKVQILPDNLISLFHLYFILRDLKLERDNRRKCMIELREAVAYPYKGYIFCQSEGEAHDCMRRLKADLHTNGLSEMYCGISHGCSEYGLKYPEFKFSVDGAHRNFRRPPSWDQLENSFGGLNLQNQIRTVDRSNSIFTIRDMLGFATWIKYAEIIRDDTHKQFVNDDDPIGNTLVTFGNRVTKQAHLRQIQLKELQERRIN